MGHQCAVRRCQARELRARKLTSLTPNACKLLADRNLRLKKLGEEASEVAVACADNDPSGRPRRRRILSITLSSHRDRSVPASPLSKRS